MPTLALPRLDDAAPPPRAPCSAKLLVCRCHQTNLFSPMLDATQRHDLAPALTTLGFLLNPNMAFPQFHRWAALPCYPQYPELAMPFAAAAPQGFEGVVDPAHIGPERGAEHLFIVNLINVFHFHGGLRALLESLWYPDRLGLEGLQLFTGLLQHIAPRLVRNTVRAPPPPPPPPPPP